MSVKYSNIVGTDVNTLWRPETEAHFTPDSDAVKARMDELATEARAAGLVATFGMEIECQLVGENPPDKERFYEEVIASLCDGTVPLSTDKGQIRDPWLYQQPVLMSKLENGTYNNDQPGSKIIEIASAPAEWEEALERYWRMVAALGERAATYGCKIDILNTHLSTVLYGQYKLNEGDRWFPICNTTRNLALVAMQYARRHLQPFELRYGNVGAHESFPSKAARWAIWEVRDETRYVGGGLVDPRVEMLGAQAGLVIHINDELPATEKQSIRACQEVRILTMQRYGETPKTPTAEALDGLAVLDPDTNELLLPTRLTRLNVRAAIGSKGLPKLDELVASLSGGTVEDFSHDDAQLLRDAVSALRFDPATRNTYVDQSNPHASVWRDEAMAHVVRMSETARIVADSPYDHAQGVVRNRELAATSPVVARILGETVLGVLTPATQAQARLAQRKRTWPKRHIPATSNVPETAIVA